MNEPAIFLVKDKKNRFWEAQCPVLGVIIRDKSDTEAYSRCRIMCADLCKQWYAFFRTNPSSFDPAGYKDEVDDIERIAKELNLFIEPDDDEEEEEEISVATENKADKRQRKSPRGAKAKKK